MNRLGGWSTVGSVGKAARASMSKDSGIFRRDVIVGSRLVAVNPLYRARYRLSTVPSGSRRPTACTCCLLGEEKIKGSQDLIRIVLRYIGRLISKTWLSPAAYGVAHRESTTGQPASWARME